jgi:hypothetical protein
MLTLIPHQSKNADRPNKRNGKVEIKLDSSSDYSDEIEQQKGKPKQGKTVNSVVAKRKKIPDSTHASKKVLLKGKK